MGWEAVYIYAQTVSLAKRIHNRMLLSWVCACASLFMASSARACASPAARLLFLARAPAGPRAGHPRCPANHTQSGQHDAVQQCVALLRHVSTHSSGRAKAPCAGSRLLPLFHTLPTHSTQESLERRASLSPSPCWEKTLLW